MYHHSLLHLCNQLVLPIVCFILLVTFSTGTPICGPLEYLHNGMCCICICPKDYSKVLTCHHGEARCVSNNSLNTTDDNEKKIYGIFNVTSECYKIPTDGGESSDLTIILIVIAVLVCLGLGIFMYGYFKKWRPCCKRKSNGDEQIETGDREVPNFKRETGDGTNGKVQSLQGEVDTTHTETPCSVGEETEMTPLRNTNGSV